MNKPEIGLYHFDSNVYPGKWVQWYYDGKIGTCIAGDHPSWKVGITFEFHTDFALGLTYLGDKSKEALDFYERIK